MKINAVEIRPGNILEYEGGIWRAVKIQHTQPGKGGAYMQVEMKNLIDGRKNNVLFRSAESLEKVRLETTDFQFLFREGDQLTFMDKINYEQITLPADPIQSLPNYAAALAAFQALAPVRILFDNGAGSATPALASTAG